MKHILFLGMFFGLTYAHSQQYLNPDIPLANTFRKYLFVHIDEKKRNTQSNVIGTISNYPVKLSDSYDNEIRLSEKHYNNKNYDSARAVLEKAIVAESNNPFILNPYARACYYTDRATSYIIYKKLILQLDSTYGNSDTLTVIDIWFQESYWKLGTLYMDNKEWIKAYYEISRFLGTIQNSKGKPVYIQALQYLTECAFNSYDDKLAVYLANRVLLYDKHNEYALMVLKEIKHTPTGPQD